MEIKKLQPSVATVIKENWCVYQLSNVYAVFFNTYLKIPSEFVEGESLVNSDQ